MRYFMLVTALGAAAVYGAAVDQKDVEYAHPDGKAVRLDLHVPDGPGRSRLPF
jgi:hypothetical protein